jgi:hypothetical protein
MKAGKDNTLNDLNPGRCCYRCYTPENVYNSERGQGRLYIKIIPENEVLLAKLANIHMKAGLHLQFLLRFLVRLSPFHGCERVGKELMRFVTGLLVHCYQEEKRATNFCE